MYGQSDRSTVNSGRATRNRSLTWEVFLAPSIPAVAPDVAPGETARPWPPISSTLISGERDAVLGADDCKWRPLVRKPADKTAAPHSGAEFADLCLTLGYGANYLLRLELKWGLTATEVSDFARPIMR